MNINFKQIIAIGHCCWKKAFRIRWPCIFVGYQKVSNFGVYRTKTAQHPGIMGQDDQDEGVTAGRMMET